MGSLSISVRDLRLRKSVIFLPTPFLWFWVTFNVKHFILPLILRCTFRLNELSDFTVNQNYICSIRLRHPSVLCFERGWFPLWWQTIYFRVDTENFELYRKWLILKNKQQSYIISKISQKTSFLVNFSALLTSFWNHFCTRFFVLNVQFQMPRPLLPTFKFFGGQSLETKGGLNTINTNMKE